ncbi:MAG TPA: CGNR zinc finger domain-containing protein [Candidatus Limnocylindria bacterium]|nr:CGNR zinc finger domain-containing protein [Candidatus Limnocylindria bacterium]
MATRLRVSGSVDRSALLAVANTRHGHEARRPFPAPITCADGSERDRLLDPEGAKAFLAACGLAVPDAPLDDAHVEALRQVRAAVRALASGDADAYRDGLAALSTGATFRLRGRELRPEAPGWDGVIAALLIPLTELYAQRERLKRCENPACGWVFVDETRGRNQVWCADQGCGPRLRVREFRRRRRIGITAA